MATVSARYGIGFMDWKATYATLADVPVYTDIYHYKEDSLENAIERAVNELKGGDYGV